MKIHSFILAGAMLALASCAGKVSDVTEITGTVELEGVTEVTVQVQDVVDTLVPVVDGKFALTLPLVDVLKAGRVFAGNNTVTFIPDGTPLNVVLNGDNPLGKVTSKYPKISATEKLNAYVAEENVYVEEYMAKRKEIMADTLLTNEEMNARMEEFSETFFERYNEHNKSVVAANTDNYVALPALGNLRGQIEADEMLSLIEILSPAVQETEMVKALKKALEASAATAEGQMFTDFTVNSVVGMTRSIPPQYKYGEVKLSDYVGKGKYILVDFWASWCGPCKAEVPNLKNIYDKYNGENFDMLSVAVWDKPEASLKAAESLGMNWNHIVNAESVPTELYGIQGIPHIILFGPDGTILKRDLRGEAIGEELAKYLDK